MELKGALWIRVLAWLGLLAVVVCWRFWPQLTDDADRPERPITDLIALEIRRATPEQWRLSLAELGERRLARLLTVQGPETLAHGVLLRFDRGQGTELAYIRHPQEEDPGRALNRLMNAMVTQDPSRKARLYFFGGEEPVTPQELLELPMHDRLPPGWVALRAPGSLPD